MTAPIFLNIEQLMDLLLFEMPEGVYATDRADNMNPNLRSYSSSEIRAHAQMLANLYSNLQNIYFDKFATTVTPEGLPKWELDYFGAYQDGSLTYAQRQTNLLAKIRASGSIDTEAITSVVETILGPLGLSFRVLAWNGRNNINGYYGTWILDFSSLDWDTYLGMIDMLMGAQRSPGLVPLSCSHDWAAAGITQEEMIEMEEQAYTYEIDIYGDASAATIAQLDAALTKYEPARSKHVIFNNVTPVPPIV